MYATKDDLSERKEACLSDVFADSEAAPMAPRGRRDIQKMSRVALITAEMFSLKLSSWKHKTTCNTTASHSRVHLC